MTMAGGCYCGAVRYEVSGDALYTGQCHCRECQYFSGGAPSMILGVPEGHFRYSRAMPKTFTRGDLEAPVTREFCGECGTHLLTRAPAMPGTAILKAGTLDDPGLFAGPQVAVFVSEAQSYHVLPEGVVAFDRIPG